MLKYLIALLPAVALAQNCVIQDRTVTRSQARIEERAQITRTVVPDPAGRRCMVTFRGRVGATWYTGFGEYTWNGERPSEDACSIAYSRAEGHVVQQAGAGAAVSDRTLVCKDQDDLTPLRQVNPGTMAKLAQYRPHPDYPREFYHNGARCRWFLDSAFVQSDIKLFQGVICHLRDDRWVVVDKF